VFLELLGNVAETSNCALSAYSLMDKHHHQLIETPEGKLSKGMRQLKGVYT
jgi:REP element-mobilizing transposase RayT